MTAQAYLADLLARAAQELQEWVDAAEESGAECGATKALLTEIDEALLTH